MGHYSWNVLKRGRIIQIVDSWAACVDGECPALTTRSCQMHGTVSTGAFPASAVAVHWWADQAGTQQESSLHPVQSDSASFGSQCQARIPKGAKNVAVFEGLSTQSALGANGHLLSPSAHPASVSRAHCLASHALHSACGECGFLPAAMIPIDPNC